MPNWHTFVLGSLLVSDSVFGLFQGCIYSIVGMSEKSSLACLSSFQDTEMS